MAGLLDTVQTEMRGTGLKAVSLRVPGVTQKVSAGHSGHGENAESWRCPSRHQRHRLFLACRALPSNHDELENPKCLKPNVTLLNYEVKEIPRGVG